MSEISETKQLLSVVQIAVRPDLELCPKFGCHFVRALKHRNLDGFLTTRLSIFWIVKTVGNPDSCLSGIWTNPDLERPVFKRSLY